MQERDILMPNRALVLVLFIAIVFVFYPGNSYSEDAPSVDPALSAGIDQAISKLEEKAKTAKGKTQKETKDLQKEIQDLIDKLRNHKADRARKDGLKDRIAGLEKSRQESLKGKTPGKETQFRTDLKREIDNLKQDLKDIEKAEKDLEKDLKKHLKGEGMESLEKIREKGAQKIKAEETKEQEQEKLKQTSEEIDQLRARNAELKEQIESIQKHLDEGTGVGTEMSKENIREKQKEIDQNNQKIEDLEKGLPVEARQKSLEKRIEDLSRELSEDLERLNREKDGLTLEQAEKAVEEIEKKEELLEQLKKKLRELRGEEGKLSAEPTDELVLGSGPSLGTGTEEVQYPPDYILLSEASTLEESKINEGSQDSKQTVLGGILADMKKSRAPQKDRSVGSLKMDERIKGIFEEKSPSEPPQLSGQAPAIDFSALSTPILTDQIPADQNSAGSILTEKLPGTPDSLGGTSIDLDPETGITTERTFHPNIGIIVTKKNEEGQVIGRSVEPSPLVKPTPGIRVTSDQKGNIDFYEEGYPLARLRPDGSATFIDREKNTKTDLHTDGSRTIIHGSANGGSVVIQIDPFGRITGTQAFDANGKEIIPETPKPVLTIKPEEPTAVEIPAKEPVKPEDGKETPVPTPSQKTETAIGTPQIAGTIPVKRTDVELHNGHKFVLNQYIFISENILGKIINHFYKTDLTHKTPKSITAEDFFNYAKENLSPEEMNELLNDAGKYLTPQELDQIKILMGEPEASFNRFNIGAGKSIASLGGVQDFSRQTAFVQADGGEIRADSETSFSTSPQQESFTTSAAPYPIESEH